MSPSSGWENGRDFEDGWDKVSFVATVKEPGKKAYTTPEYISLFLNVRLYEINAPTHQLVLHPYSQRLSRVLVLWSQSCFLLVSHLIRFLWFSCLLSLFIFFFLLYCYRLIPAHR